MHIGNNGELKTITKQICIEVYIVVNFWIPSHLNKDTILCFCELFSLVTPAGYHLISIL